MSKEDKEDLENAAESSRHGHDYTLKMMEEAGIPLTRENYLASVYPEETPEDRGPELEMGLPAEIQKEEYLPEKRSSTSQQETVVQAIAKRHGMSEDEARQILDEMGF